MTTHKKWSNVLIYVLSASALTAAILYFSGVFVPDSLKAGKFNISIASRGEVLSSTLASGIVAPENEVLILSPSASMIKSILKEPGSRVEAGDIIMQLDEEPVLDDISRLKDQLEMRRNNLERTELNAQSTKLDLDYNEEVKKLRIVSLKSQLADQEQLLEVGGISPARVEETKQEITLAEKDLQMLLEKNLIRLKQLEAEEKGLIMQIRMDEKALEDRHQVLADMDITAPMAGIILTVSGQVGEKVSTDKLLVKMSDLTSFKIIGSAEEKFASQINTGDRVVVNLEGEPIEGRVGMITPVVENNRIQFNVHLTRKDHPKLMANQQVQIHIVNDQKPNTLRINKIPNAEPNQTKTVFVVEADKAVKKEIKLGMIGDEFCEVLSGLEEGDAVLMEDPSTFKQVSELSIKK